MKPRSLSPTLLPTPSLTTMVRLFSHDLPRSLTIFASAHRSFRLYLLSDIICVNLVFSNITSVSYPDIVFEPTLSRHFLLYPPSPPSHPILPFAIALASPSLPPGKHHNTYVTNLNKLIVGTGLENSSIEEVCFTNPPTSLCSSQISFLSSPSQTITLSGFTSI